MDFNNTLFRRLFSVNLRKKLRIKLSEMSFENDFTNTERGDLYPLINKGNMVIETVNNGTYSVSNGCVRRLICEHFPFAEYSIEILHLTGKAGFSFFRPDTGKIVDIFAESKGDSYSVAYVTEGRTFECDFTVPASAKEISFGTRGKWVDVYCKSENHINLAGSLEIEALNDSCKYPFPFKTLLFCDCVNFETSKVEAYIDNGTALADMKPVRYIDGSNVELCGRLYFTMTSRLASGGYQSVISWLPGTCDFRLEGIILFDINNRSVVSADIASCVLFDKENNEFLIWMCSFSCGHILGYGRTDGDILHGISIIDIKLMNSKPGCGEAEFYALEGDEDPDFYYDDEKKKWFLSVCRVRNFGDRQTYSYVKFISDDPFVGYRFYCSTDNKGETGGLTTAIDGKRYFMCGADMSSVSKYRIYDADNLSLISEAEYDYPDGGFRGWGTLVPVKCGNKQRVFQITFDRVLSSEFNWSYGNLYVFEAVEQN